MVKLLKNFEPLLLSQTVVGQTIVRAWKGKKNQTPNKPPFADEECVCVFKKALHSLIKTNEEITNLHVLLLLWSSFPS